MLTYASELARLMDEYPLILYSFVIGSVIYITWIPFVASGVIFAIFRPKKLPPFKDAFRGYVFIWWRFMVLLVAYAAEVYVLKYWEESVNIILAVSIVCFPLSLVWVNRDYVKQRSWVFLGMTLVVVSIPVILYQSNELRWILIPFGVGVVAGLLIYGLLKDSIKVAYKLFPKLTSLSLISMMLLYPTLWIMGWVHYSIPSWQWPWWYQSLGLAGVVLSCLAFLPLIMMEFLKLR
jgi:hypothetical protein